MLRPLMMFLVLYFALPAFGSSLPFERPSNEEMGRIRLPPRRRDEPGLQKDQDGQMDCVERVGHSGQARGDGLVRSAHRT